MSINATFHSSRRAAFGLACALLVVAVFTALQSRDITLRSQNSPQLAKACQADGWRAEFHKICAGQS